MSIWIYLTWILHGDGLPLLSKTPKQRDTGEIVPDYLPFVYSAGKIPPGETFHFTCQLSYLDCQLKFNTLFFSSLRLVHFPNIMPETDFPPAVNFKPPNQLGFYGVNTDL